MALGGGKRGAEEPPPLLFLSSMGRKEMEWWDGSSPARQVCPLLFSLSQAWERSMSEDNLSTTVSFFIVQGLGKRHRCADTAFLIVLRGAVVWSLVLLSFLESIFACNHLLL